MDTRSTDHPTYETLQAFWLGKLDDAAAEAVNQHLEGCPDCRRQAAEMAPDSFLARLRDAHGAAATSTSPGATDIPPADLLEKAADTEPQTTIVDHATFDYFPPPYVSSTGHLDPTSEAKNGANAPALQSGTCIGYFGDYELEKVLGEGGMGIVYKARQLTLNRPVALKMIRTARFASADEVRRFQNEAEAVARLDHPHIVPIFEVGKFEDQHYFSMKLIAGESLDKRLKDYVSDPQRAAQIVLVAAGAVHHAHQRGILHRDLKPANILVDSEGSPHVTDFGLAKRVEGDSELTQSGEILGTPAYMAPEQASGKRGAVTTATDIYGLGAILYALLTGRAPFGGATVAETLEQVRERPPESLRKLNSRVPRDLEVIGLKCLEKDPRRRYASADALAEDLQRWLSGEPIAARPVGNTARFWMWCRRNPIVAGATGTVAASLVAVAVLSLLYASQQARHANEQTQASANIKGLNEDLKQERQDLETSLANSNRRLAMFYFERAQRAFDGGEVGHGLLWLVESWRSAITADDSDWQRLARENLSLWKSSSCELKVVLPHGEGAYWLAFSPDGKTILSTNYGGSRGSESTTRLRDVTTGLPIGEPIRHPRSKLLASFSPDGRVFLTGGPNNSARLWGATTGKSIGQPMEHPAHLNCAAFSPDGKFILTGADDSSRLWDAISGQFVFEPMLEQSSVSAVAFSPNGKTAVTAGKSDYGVTGTGDEAFLWDTATGQPVGEPMRHRGDIRSVAFSSDGKSILTTT